MRYERVPREKMVRSIIGLLLFALGIGFLLTIVPRVQGTDLRLGDYVWAFVIIFACSVGFGLIAAGVFWEDDHS